ncbi:hypothetical protein TNCV_3111401 [Trichonephila clavipes]|nr:hypothetical protein TNCV_3111401 [Trichonephila clavipes]
MTRRKGLSSDEIANLLRELSEKESEGGLVATVYSFEVAAVLKFVSSGAQINFSQNRFGFDKDIKPK